MNPHHFAPLPGFMFRERELARIARVVDEGRSVLLVGIRNTGKTQLMKKALTEHAARFGPGSAAFLDVQNLFELATFYRLLLAGLPKPLVRRAWELLSSTREVPNKLMEWLKRHIDEVEGFGFSIDLQDPTQIVRYWEPVQLAVERAVAESKPESLPLLGIDELPFMVEHLLAHGVAPQDVTLLLASLRKLQAAGLRMIIGGSISLETLLSLNRIPTTVLGQLWREEVPPFARDEAAEFLVTKLGAAEVVAHIPQVLELLPDWVPSHLDTARLLLADLPSPVRADDITWCMHERVMPAISAAFLKQFEERLIKHFPAEQRALAEALLDQVAHAPETGGRIDSTGMPPAWRDALSRLQADFFLRDAPGLGYRFSLRLLRQWWRAQRGMA